MNKYFSSVLQPDKEFLDFVANSLISEEELTETLMLMLFSAHRKKPERKNTEKEEEKKAEIQSEEIP